MVAWPHISISWFGTKKRNVASKSSLSAGNTKPDS